jgi:hypothetical protein
MLLRGPSRRAFGCAELGDGHSRDAAVAVILCILAAEYSIRSQHQA